ncbi:MAG: hypothetical protein ACFE7E_05205 [Candidatus Hodarchaeota archaeon]
MVSEKQHKKSMKKGYTAEQKAFKAWDKSEYKKAADYFKEAADFFEEAINGAPSVGKKKMAVTNTYVERCNYYWVYGLKYYFEDEDYEKAAQYFKKAIQVKQKMFQIEKYKKGQEKPDPWLVRQQASLRELYALFYLSSGIVAEKGKKIEKAAELFENAARNYLRQATLYEQIGKPLHGSRVHAYSAYLRAGESYRRAKQLKKALKYYLMIMNAYENAAGSLKKRLKSVVALTHAQLGEYHKTQDNLGEAVKEYKKFFKWAKKIKLDEEQADEVTRSICIFAAIQVKQDRPNEAERMVKSFKGQTVAKNVKPFAERNWYKLAVLIAEFGMKEDGEILREAKLAYNLMDNEKKDPFISSFLEEFPK